MEPTRTTTVAVKADLHMFLGILGLSGRNKQSLWHPMLLPATDLACMWLCLGPLCWLELPIETMLAVIADVPTSSYKADLGLQLVGLNKQSSQHLMLVLMTVLAP